MKMKECVIVPGLGELNMAPRTADHHFGAAFLELSAGQGGQPEDKAEH